MEPADAHQTDRTRARKLIQKLGRKNGYVEQKYWDELTEESHEVFSEAFGGLLGSLEPAIKALAKSLYSSNAQFIFELLQNAEDNEFVHAKQPAYVSFHMSRDKLIVECNEDGFTEENLHAICDIGRSSKQGAQGFIGEKGIGFKSVFMAAYRVHIQSGFYSFAFEHHLKDSGIGMIRPICQDPTEELPPHLTRITLYLHTKNDVENPASQRDSIRRQLRELNGDVLLFMRHLKEIRVIIDGEKPKTSTTFTKSEVSQERTTILKTVKKGDELETSSIDYFVVKRWVFNLARNENRTYSEKEEKQKAYSTAKVILAFPLSSDSVPIVESQKIFAFLPVKTAGFSFLIQSDFMTNASREGIVITAQRNIDLLDGIRDTFIKAVLRFCQHPKLQYTWMRFLPDKDNDTYDTFWSGLVDKIQQKVRTTPLIRPGSGGPLQLITQLRQPRPLYTDRQNDLLLRDLKPEIGVSRQYMDKDLAILENYGMVRLSWKEFIKIVKQDLASTSSWIKVRTSDQYLQSKVADRLNWILREAELESEGKRIRKLPILPLQDGRWVAARNITEVFLPDTGGLSIPGDLEFNLISSDWAARPESCDLFRSLGVKTLSVERVREAIFKRHRYSHSKKGGRLIQHYADQLKFLFSTHCPTVHEQSQYTEVVLVNSENRKQIPTKDDIYIPDDSPLGPQELLGPKESDDGASETELAPDLDFLHDMYLEAPETPDQHGLDWYDWLVEYIGVRRSLRLTNMHSSAPDLSDACYYVAEHRQEKFIALLYDRWQEESKNIKGNPTLLETLKNIEVLCQGDHMVSLQNTYLPLPHLTSQARRFLTGEKFPLLQLEGSLESKLNDRTWSSLARELGIGTDDNLEFFLDILSTIRDTNSKHVSYLERVLALYNKLHGMYLQTFVFKARFIDTIRERFNNDALICVPDTEAGDFLWAFATECLWEAPSCMESAYPLKARMQSVFTEGPTEFSALESFFSHLIAIENCDYTNIIQELEVLSSNGQTELGIVCELYRQLDSMIKDLSVTKQRNIKLDFSKKSLIYSDKESGSWHKTSQCLWSSETEMHGWAILESHYTDLRGFFVDFLGVKTLSLELVYNELLQLGSASDTTVDQVKANIWTLNSFIAIPSKRPDVDRLLNSKILPVKHPQGHETLCDFTADFVIVDRMHLGSLFKNRVPTLGFTFDEVRRLESTISWLGLATRFLSRRVTESSRVEGAGKKPLSSRNRRIAPKAHALYRIAYHYNSPRLEPGNNLYQTLKSAQVYETDGIASTLTLSVGELSHEVDKSRCELHIQNDGSLLEIFVPRDKKDQESCYVRRLPLRLFDWLMSDSGRGEEMYEKGKRVMASVLNASCSVVPMILEDEGIALGDLEDGYAESEDGSELEVAHVTEHNPPAGGSQDVSIASDGDNKITSPTLTETDLGETSSRATPTSSGNSSPVRQKASVNRSRMHSTPTSKPQAIRPRGLASPSVLKETSLIQATTHLQATNQQPASHVVPASPGATELETSRYRALLERVVTAARATPRLPSQGAFDMAGMSNALPVLEAGHGSYDGPDSIHRFRSTSQLERDKKIGVAGELYVFELLKNIEPRLPGFSLENWKSTIRGYAQAHPEYANIQSPTGGREIADLVYDDVEGTLTSLFIDNGYLAKEDWEGKKPRYLLEVKSTTGPCHAPFFMSKRQYQRIHDHQHDASTVYVILRVFNVGKASVQLRVYVNPAQLEEDNQLVFTAETLSVAPAP
ncbi:hypothetical protein NW762_010053 [Fusarium torreyae]|uniref:Protein NO VEIN C-terminal domain-containing protein n=1 Tax=Fusarium torreyae TaxID=1237075 RepID=A0A9W8RVV1_9HYPO|nr:hypothetical protein NW762_010053 [Fusarium torreyae]